jgi:hypothetical protein
VTLQTTETRIGIWDNHLIDLLTDFYRRRRFIFDTSAAEGNNLAGGRSILFILLLQKYFGRRLIEIPTSAAEDNTSAGGRSILLILLLLKYFGRRSIVIHISVAEDNTVWLAVDCYT